MTCIIWLVKQDRSPNRFEGDVLRAGKDFETLIGPTREAIAEQLEPRPPDGELKISD